MYMSVCLQYNISTNNKLLHIQLSEIKDTTNLLRMLA